MALKHLFRNVEALKYQIVSINVKLDLYHSVSQARMLNSAEKSALKKNNACS
jgi:hypothetical protein